MTRGETRILDELTGEWFDRWVSVSKLATVLKYTRRFVEKTAEHLYWNPPGRVRLSRTYARKDWHYRVINIGGARCRR